MRESLIKQKYISIGKINNKESLWYGLECLYKIEQVETTKFIDYCLINDIEELVCSERIYFNKCDYIYKIMKDIYNIKE